MSFPAASCRAPAPFLRRRLRTSEAFELVLYDRLKPDEQQRLGHLARNPDLYGVLLPKARGGSVKAVDRETALLLFCLREPGILPHYAARDLDEISLAQLKDLVLSGILEVEGDGGFVTGSQAFDLLPRSTVKGAMESLAWLSRRAVRHVAFLGLQDGAQIFQRLYAFHSVPLTRAWCRRLGSDEAVRRFLEWDARHLESKLSRHWRFQNEIGAPWWSWWRRLPSTTGSSSSAVYKLYVSPAMEDLPRTFHHLVDGVAETRARGFKIGRGALGLLRPDKMVLYFDDFEDLAEAANLLANAFRDVQAQGVPFTSEIALGGLLSWGVDPPWTARLPEQRSQSWRTWIVQRLANYLTEYDGATEAAAEFVIERLRLQGVNTDSWNPCPALWQEV